MEWIQPLVSVLLIGWAFGTTIYSLHLSRQNNIRYNQRIIELLESINQNLKGLEVEDGQ